MAGHMMAGAWPGPSGPLVDTDILNTRTDYWGAYVQDSWKATDRLNLKLGLRWVGGHAPLGSEQ